MLMPSTFCLGDRNRTEYRFCIFCKEFQEIFLLLANKATCYIKEYL